MKKDLISRKEKEALVGSTVKGLKLLSLEYKKFMPVYKYLCTICSNRGEVKYYALMGKTLEGCRKCAQKHNAMKKWTGEGEISGEFLYSMVATLKKRERECEVSKEYLWQLFLEQNRVCPLSGITLFFATSSSTRDGNASLDRIDNTKGYIEGNVRWVDKNINMIRRRLTDNDFIWFCKQVSEHNISKEVTVPDLTKFII